MISRIRIGCITSIYRLSRKRVLLGESLTSRPARFNDRALLGALIGAADRRYMRHAGARMGATGTYMKPRSGDDNAMTS